MGDGLGGTGVARGGPSGWHLEGISAAPKRRWTRRRASLIAATAFVGAWNLGFAQAASVTDLLPNLVADPPSRAYLSSEMGRLLLRFDGYVHNIGPGPLEVTGQRASIAEPMI